MRKKQDSRPIGKSRSPKESAKRYAVQVIPGLEDLARMEIEQALENVSGTVNLPAGERNSTVVFSSRSAPPRPEKLRLAEDLFRVVVEAREVGTGPEGLAAIGESLDHPEIWSDALAEWRYLHHARQKNKTSYRIVSRADSSALFSRHALARHTERILKRFTKPGWLPVENQAEVEVWLQLTQRHFVAMLRLSDPTMRHRTYKEYHLPGSLRPTLAAALVTLTDPKPSDRFLDPMCGVGTIPLERSLWGPARMIAGADINPEALFYCRQNSDQVDGPPAWLHCDAASLPFPDYSIDRVATNLPFGEKSGNPKEIPSLYGRVVSEVGRILRPGGIAVFLTSRKSTLLKAIGDRGPLYRIKSVRVKILGRSAEITKVIKK